MILWLKIWQSLWSLFFQDGGGTHHIPDWSCDLEPVYAALPAAPHTLDSPAVTAHVTGKLNHGMYRQVGGWGKCRLIGNSLLVWFCLRVLPSSWSSLHWTYPVFLGTMTCVCVMYKLAQSTHVQMHKDHISFTSSGRSFPHCGRPRLVVAFRLSTIRLTSAKLLFPFPYTHTHTHHTIIQSELILCLSLTIILSISIKADLEKHN